VPPAAARTLENCTRACDRTIARSQFLSKENAMRTRIQASVAAALLALALGGCADMSRAEKGAVAGAVVGGAVGHAATDGSTLGTVGGAAVGGVVGHEVGKRY
jgi:osmotically inducible lipoprotein OsmB